MMDDALLYGEMAKAKRPADWTVVSTPQSFEAYGCMMRKDDPGFKKVVDAAMARRHDLRRGRGKIYRSGS